MNETEINWTRWKDIEFEVDESPINEVITPRVIVRFTDDDKTWSIQICRGENKPELTFGSKEPRHISIGDVRIPEIAELESTDFCQVAAYVTGVAQSIGNNDYEMMRKVSQDYERVIEAARIRAAQGEINMVEAEAIFDLHTAVVVQGTQASRVLREELPA